MNKILEKARAIEQEIIADRRCLHQMPEVGVYTPRTAAYIKERLTEMGIAHRDCGVHSQEDREKMVFAGYPDAPTSTGVVAVIGKGGPCILLRADMDGLPMEETTGLDFAAKGDTAHMCGHDAHAAMLLGAAFVVLCDVLARCLFAPFELPVGILLSLIGGPFFLGLLLHGRGRRMYD